MEEEVEFHRFDYNRAITKAEKVIPHLSVLLDTVSELGKSEAFIKDAIVSPSDSLLSVAKERAGEAGANMNNHALVEAYHPCKDRFLSDLHKVIRSLSDSGTTVNDYDMTDGVVRLSEPYVNELKRKHTTYAETPEELDRLKALKALASAIDKYNAKASELNLSRITMQSRLQYLIRLNNEGKFEPNAGLIKFPQ